MIRTLIPIVALGALLSGQMQAQTAAQSGARPAPAVKPGGIVNLNTATAAELQGLPGVGMATATRIIEYRQKNGPFQKVEELMNVQGIGEKTFLRLKPQITVAPKPPAPAVSQN